MTPRPPTSTLFPYTTLFRSNAQQNFLRLGIRERQIMTIVCRYERNSRLSRDAHNALVHALIDIEPLVLHFEEKIPFAKNFLQTISRRARLLVTILQHVLGNFAAQARRKSNQPAAVLRQKVVINPRLVIEPIEESCGNQPD